MTGTEILFSIMIICITLKKIVELSLSYLSRRNAGERQAER